MGAFLAAAGRGASPLKVAFAGLCALVLSMGIGRFAYTALLPQMHASGELTLPEGSLLASANYAGYLLGALWAAFSRDPNSMRRLTLGVLLSVLTSAAMALDAGKIVWFVLRFLAGVASAVVYIYTTGVVLRYLAQQRASGWNGLYYAGVGVGISLSALLAHVFQAAPQSWPGWLALGGVSALAAVVALRGLWLADAASGPAQRARAESEPERAEGGETDKDSDKDSDKESGHDEGEEASATVAPMRWMVLAYGLAGLGYIINATFLPLMLRSQTQAMDLAMLGWFLVGLAAIPATVLWVRLGVARGAYRALLACTALQALGVALPVLTGAPWAALSGALLLGGTFMGIAGLAQWLVRVPDPRHTVRRIGLMTAAYGVGQIAGPLLAALLVVGDDFTRPVLMASGALLLSCVCLLLSHRYERLEEKAVG